MRLGYVSPFVAVVVVTVAITVGPTPTGQAAHRAVASTSAVIRACDLRLPPPTGGSPRFAIPEGGRATVRALVGGFRLCRLLRADGSRFATAQIDRLGQVLEIHFFRRSGTFLFAADAQFPAKATAEGPTSVATTTHTAPSAHAPGNAEEWTINAGEGGYDVQSVAAHEFGHVRQFDHVTTGDNTVVMWPYVSKGDTSLRKLGRGDSLGNNAKY